MQTTLIFLKPDAVQRGLMGELITRFERKGLTFVGMKLVSVDRAVAGEHYAEHEGRPFYEGLLDFVTSSPVLVLAVRGVEAIAVCRKLIGATNARNAEPGTIRGDLGMSGGQNLIHASDSPESAQRELSLWFKPDEICDTDLSLNQWIYDPSDL